MTTLEVYNNVLVEIHKEGAPSLLLSDFNYFLNKGIYQKINSDYNFYDMNQQIVDSLISLRVVVDLPLVKNKTMLPGNYLHILRCGVVFDSYGHCNNSIKKAAIRLLSDQRDQLESNYYMKPSSKRPYFILLNNLSNVELSILSGNSEAKSVSIDYLKKPMTYSLTEEQINDEEDVQVLEFPEYVCYEIVNEVTKLIMDNNSDPRLQTNLPINKTIAPPIGGK